MTTPEPLHDEAARLAKAIREAIERASLASCTCGAKSPDPQWHTPECRWRILCGAALMCDLLMDELRALASAPVEPAGAGCQTWPTVQTDSLVRQSLSWVEAEEKKGRTFISDMVRALCERVSPSLPAPEDARAAALREAERAVLKAADQWAYSECAEPDDDLMDAIIAWTKLRDASPAEPRPEGASAGVQEAALRKLDDEEAELRESEARRYELDAPFTPNPRLAEIAAAKRALASDSRPEAGRALREVVRELNRAMDAWEDGNVLADDSRWHEGWQAAIDAVRQRLAALAAPSAEGRGASHTSPTERSESE